MKIFSSFDTNFKQEVIDREKKKYWDKHFIIVSHGKFYYYFFVVIPTVLWIFGAIIYLTIFLVLWLSVSQDFKTIYYIIWLLMFFVFFSPLVMNIIKKYIDYILDFFVVNPRNIIYYNQEWLLNRKWRTISLEKIKTISVKKEWLLRSIFNFWNIIILTEWDEKWEWEINISFIDNPDIVKHNIFEIVNLWEENKA